MYLDFLTTLQMSSLIILGVVLTLNIINQFILLGTHDPNKKIIIIIDYVNKYSPYIIAILVILFIITLTLYFLFSNEIYNLGGLNNYMHKMKQAFIQGS